MSKNEEQNYASKLLEIERNLVLTNIIRTLGVFSSRSAPDEIEDVFKLFKKLAVEISSRTAPSRHTLAILDKLIEVRSMYVQMYIESSNIFNDDGIEIWEEIAEKFEKRDN